MVFDDFFNWLDSDAGEASWQAIDDIKLAFDGADVDLKERKIIWADGERLSIDQSALKIKEISEVDINVLKNHIVLWLEMDYVPEGLNKEEMENFEDRIYEWINDYESDRKSGGYRTNRPSDLHCDLSGGGLSGLGAGST